MKRLGFASALKYADW